MYWADTLSDQDSIMVETFSKDDIYEVYEPPRLPHNQPHNVKIRRSKCTLSDQDSTMINYDYEDSSDNDSDFIYDVESDEEDSYDNRGNSRVQFEFEFREQLPLHKQVAKDKTLKRVVCVLVPCSMIGLLLLMLWYIGVLT